MWQTWVVIPSFLGIGLGLWIVSITNKNSRLLRLFESWSFHILSASFILVFFLIGVLAKKIDQDLLLSASGKSIGILEEVSIPIIRKSVLEILSIVSTPFLIFGLILGLKFENRSSAAASYAVELLGMILGSLLCMFILESVSWVCVAFLIVALNILAQILSELHRAKTIRRRIVSVVIPLVILGLFIFSAPKWEINRNIHIVARDFNQTAKITPIETRWKSMAKVQLIDVERRGVHRKRITIGEGKGISYFTSYADPLVYNPEIETVGIATLNQPKKVLVLFAGAGAELQSLQGFFGDKVETWGVEINPAISEIAKIVDGSKFDEFYREHLSHYIVSDNRRFLENTHEKFNDIIYSWSGSNVINFSGAVIHATQYSFTFEAIQTALRHLAPKGRIIIMGGNKLNILMTLKKLEENSEISAVKESILLFDHSPPTYWKRSWDDFILIYQDGGWQQNEIDQVSSRLTHDYLIGLQPDKATSQFEPYLKLINSNQFMSFAQNLWIDEGILPVLATDDFPFAYRNRPSVFSSASISFSERIQKSFRELDFGPFEGFVCLSIFLITLVIFSIRKGDLLMPNEFLNFMMWAPLSSGVFLLFMYKAMLYFGEPTYALLVVQVAVQAGTATGLVVSRKSMRPQMRAVFFIFSLFLLGSSLVAFSDPKISTLIFQFSFSKTLILFFSVICTVSFGFAYYFVQPLFIDKRANGNSLTTLWAFETIFTGVMSLLGAFLIEELGVSAWVIAASGISIFIFILSKSIVAFRWFSKAFKN